MSSKQSIILLNNAFETTNPLMSHQFFDNAKSIVIDRDPRDIYLSAKSTGITNGVNVGETAVGGSVENFIIRFKLYRMTKDIIFDFLDVNESIHRFPKKYFQKKE